jgi:O-acetyl-ADP-ribose deacetylase (regulator of RNase III)
MKFLLLIIITLYKMKLTLVQGDITTQQTDAIVNAANSSLLGGGGVDGAIHRKGGKTILDDCIKIRNKQGKCKTGEAVITTAGNLPSNFVIHTVGPVWNNRKSNEEELLANCYLNSLRLAEDHDIQSIAFPNISTGIYKFPKKLAAEIAINTVKLYFNNNDSQIKEVVFICFDKENFNLYKERKMVVF